MDKEIDNKVIEEDSSRSMPEQNITQEIQALATPVSKEPQPVNQKRENKSWKILVYGLPAIALIAFGALGLWFYQEKIAKKPVLPIMTTATRTPIIPTPSPTSPLIPTPTSTPEPTIPADWKAYAAEKVVDYFKAFNLYYPLSWELSVDKGTDPDRQSLTLEKEGFTLLILQAPGSEASCLYPEDLMQEGMFAKYGEYKEITKSNNLAWRRAMPESQNPNELTYKVCEKTADGKYFTGSTSIGFISLKGPNFDNQILNEFDEILEKIEILD